MSTKACARCGTTKPLTEFYRERKSQTGLSAICMACVRSRVAAYRKCNADRTRDYERARAALPHRKARKVAYHAVEAAIEAGALKPEPCERCGFALGVQAHHEDYSKPLEVVWLCTKCHGARHREINAERRAARKAA